MRRWITCSKKGQVYTTPSIYAKHLRSILILIPTWEQNCVYLLQKRNLDRPSFSVNCYFCVLLFVALCQTYKEPIRWFSFIVFLYCWVFLIAVFAANQLGLILWPSVFWSTSNIANLYNPPIGAMSWSGGVTTKRKSSFSALVSFLFWHSFPFSVWSFSPKNLFLMMLLKLKAVEAW